MEWGKAQSDGKGEKRGGEGVEGTRRGRVGRGARGARDGGDGGMQEEGKRGGRRRVNVEDTHKERPVSYVLERL